MATEMETRATLQESYNKDGSCDYDDGLHDQNDNHCDYDRKIASEATTNAVIFEAHAMRCQG